MSDSSQRTEKPTPRRLEKARREGQFPVSREFVAGTQFLAFVWLLGAYGPGWFRSVEGLCRSWIQAAFTLDITPLNAHTLLIATIQSTAVPLGFAGLGIAAVSVATHLAITRFGIAGKKLAPDLTRLNPLKRLQELPRQNAVQFVSAALLLPLFCIAVFAVAQERMGVFLTLPLQSLTAGASVVARAIQSFLWKAALALFVWGAIDLVRQLRRYNRDLRMSKQEIREEAKESDGNPQVKSRIRRIQRDLARRRMMQEIPTATAVIVNPTHYAVAIRYQAESQAAPMVVAKGRNYLALRIRQRAIEHQIPIVENPPLAQALYKTVDIGQEIPAKLYRAVAEILAYLYHLRNRRR